MHISLTKKITFLNEYDTAHEMTSSIVFWGICVLNVRICYYAYEKMIIRRIIKRDSFLVWGKDEWWVMGGQ